MVSESTIDYWCKDITMVDYENTLILFLKKLSKRFDLILKEHPAAPGYRSPKFIKSVNNILDKNIFFVPSKIPSNFIIDNTDSVLVWTGSVGFEAAFRGRMVFTIGEPYYMSGRFFKQVNLKTNINYFESLINECEKYPIKMAEKNELVRNLLSGFIKGFFRNDGSFNLKNQKHKTEIITLANNISKYFI